VSSHGASDSVVLNGVRYILAQDVSRDRPGLGFWREDGELVTAKWDDWSGGMGETRRTAPDSNGYAYTERMDCTTYGLIRLPPRKISMTVLNSIQDERNRFWQGNNTYVYMRTDNIIFKFNGSGTTLRVYNQMRPGDVNGAGAPTKFEGLWYVPLQSGVNFAEITAITDHTTARVWYYDGAAYIDNSAEAITDAGTPFILLNGAITFSYFGHPTNVFGHLQFDIATAGAGATVSYQYWNGAWTALTLIADQTANFTTDGDVSFTPPADWATTVVNGVTAYWVRAVPSGAFGTAPTANSVFVGDNITKASTLQALAMATIQDGATAKIARAYSANLVALAATGPLTGGNWGSGFEVGDTSTGIVEMVDTGVALFVAKGDNLYRFDPTGGSYSIFNLPAGVLPSGQGYGLVGVSAIPSTESAFYWHPTGLHLVMGDRIRAVGIDRIPTWHSFPNVTRPPFGGVHYDTILVGNSWVYSLYDIISSAVERTYLVAGKLSKEGDITWHTVDVVESGATGSYWRGLFLDRAQRLWTSQHDYAASTNTLLYWQLAASGGPVAGPNTSLGYGAASQQHRIFFSETPFYRKNGEPVWDRLKTLRVCKVLARGLGATAPLLCQVMRDGGAIETVPSGDAGITAAGYSEKAWVSGTNDTCRLARPVLDITTTAGYTPAAATDPQILHFEMQAVLQNVRFIVDCGMTEAKGYADAKQIRDNLEKLRGAAGQTLLDPEGATLTVTITKVRDVKTELVNGKTLWLLDCEAEVNT